MPDGYSGPSVSGSSSASVSSGSVASGPVPSAAPAPVVSSSSLGPSVSSGPQPGGQVYSPGGTSGTSGPRLHTVQPGESLPSIASLYGVQIEALAAANNLAPPYSVSPGRSLRIPEPGSTAALTRPSAPSQTVSSGTLGAPQPLTSSAGQASTASPVQTASAPGGRVVAGPAPIDPPLPPRRPGTLATAGGTSTSVASVPPAPSSTASQPSTGSPGSGTSVSSTPLTSSPLTTTQVPNGGQPPASTTGNGATVTSAPPVGSPPVAGTPSPSATTQPGTSQTPAATPPAAGQGQFMWPIDGTVVSEYGPLSDGLTNDGINIAAARGTPIRAAQAGTVAYAGNELRGFGNLILIRHEGGWVTAYAHAEEISVQRGQQVEAGQTIGTVGDSGSVTSPQLHFEIRQGSEPVDPRSRLAPR